MKNIFVGNLDFAATESSIRALFEPHGNVERVNLVTDRDTGRSRGFAFVEMADSAEADRAIAALNGTELNGRALNINEARPSPTADAPSAAVRVAAAAQRRRRRWWTAAASRTTLVKSRDRSRPRSGAGFGR